VKLATRTFLWSLLPFVVLLIGSFWAARTRVLSKVREGLEVSVKQTQATLAKIRTRDDQRNSRLLRVVSQNPALKAVVQLMLGDRADAQARRTVEQQLVEIGEDLGFDYLLVSDGDGTPLAGSMLQDGRLKPLDLGKQQQPLQGYFTSAGRTYQVTSIPIDEGSENLGTLSVGERFDLSAVPGEAVLMRNGEIVESNTPGLPLKEAQAGLRGCPAEAECEIQLRGETYVSQPLEKISRVEEVSEGSGDGYQVRTLQSVDAATRDIQAALGRVFVFAGLGALAAAVLVSGLSSRSIVRPIAQVIARLHESARTGELPEFDSQRERIHEIRALTASFNQAAAAIRDGQARLQQASVEFIESLASALDARDPYTAGHSRRVSQYATATAQAMGLAPAQIQEIRVGALLHDIGKIGITDAVLQKPGRLTSEEDALIRLHPSIGRRILEGVNGFQPYLNVVELHHENWDGSGYPKGLHREATPLTARVVKIADAWDAMTSDRPYRQGMSRNQALAMLRKASGTQMDPAIIEVFCSLWGADDTAATPQHAESLTRLAEAVEPETRVEIPLREQQDA
jgi:putative nucleotidyltransferase with HDIG domain